MLRWFLWFVGSVSVIFILIWMCFGMVRMIRKKRIRDLENHGLISYRSFLTVKLTTVNLMTKEMYPYCPYYPGVKHQMATILSPDVLRVLGYYSAV